MTSEDASKSVILHSVTHPPLVRASPAWRTNLLTGVFKVAGCCTKPSKKNTYFFLPYLCLLQNITFPPSPSPLFNRRKLESLEAYQPIIKDSNKQSWVSPLVYSGLIKILAFPNSWVYNPQSHILFPDNTVRA